MIDNSINIKPEIKNWVIFNLRKGVKKTQVFKILLDQNIEYQKIKKFLKTDYEIPIKK